MGTIQSLNAEQFEADIEAGVSLIDFGAPWCSPCRLQDPIIELLAEEYVGKVSFAQMNVDENQQAAMKLGIMSIPTLIIFKDGKEIERFVGLQARNTLSVAIENALK